MVSCRTSGALFSGGGNQLVFSGRCKLMSVHLFNQTEAHATNTPGNGAGVLAVTLYDNTAASGTVLGKFMVNACSSLEMDFHGAQCHNGLFVAFDTDPHGSGGTSSVGGITVNFH
jgi:hypothetical protein